MTSIELTIEPEGAEDRLDRAVTVRVPTLSRSAVARLIAAGSVSVDGTPVTRASTPVRAGQRVRVEIPEVRPARLESQDIPLTILYQDADIAVIDKPAGLVVHPAAGHADQTLVNALLFHIGDLSGVGGEIRPGIVHRLDKDTSGILLIAKNDPAHRKLAATWNSAVEKDYTALVYGTPKQTSGVIERPIGRDPSNRKRMAVVGSGRPAVTEYRLIERLRHLSVLQCRLRTGRTHQIRVHLASIGHPIAGDRLYSGPQWKGIPDKRIQKLLRELPRQALHASRLRFAHPGTGATMELESPLPDDLRQLIEQLR